MSARRSWRRFIASVRGSSALEFALAAPVVFLAITGIIDFMMVMFVSALMEGGLLDASRLGRTGFMPATMTREDAIKEKVAQATVGLLDMSKVTISTKVYPCFDSIGEPEPFVDDSPANGSYDVGEDYTDVNGNAQWDPDMSTVGLGNPGEIVLYEIQYDWSALTPLIGPIFGPNGKIPLSVSVAVRNEPFGTPALVVSGPAGPGTTGC